MCSTSMYGVESAGWRVLLVVAIASMLVACGGDGHEQVGDCATDDDCPSGQCAGGWCTSGDVSDDDDAPPGGEWKSGVTVACDPGAAPEAGYEGLDEGQDCMLPGDEAGCMGCVAGDTDTLSSSIRQTR